MNKLKLSWSEYLTDVADFVNKVKSAGGDWKFVAGIPIHGMFPAAWISSSLGLSYIDGVAISVQLENDPSKILVVEGISESGTSFIPYMDCAKSSLYFREGTSAVVPDYIGRKFSEWVVLPYEDSELITVDGEFKGETSLQIPDDEGEEIQDFDEDDEDTWVRYSRRGR